MGLSGVHTVIDAVDVASTRGWAACALAARSKCASTRMCSVPAAMAAYSAAGELTLVAAGVGCADAGGRTQIASATRDDRNTGTIRLQLRSGALQSIHASQLMGRLCFDCSLAKS